MDRLIQLCSTALLLLLAACTVRSPEQAPAEAEVAIVNVTIVDVASGRTVPDQTIHIRGNRIIAVDDSTAARGRTVDGTGKYAIPGLWDMHVHLFNNGSDAGQ